MLLFFLIGEGVAWTNERTKRCYQVLIQYRIINFSHECALFTADASKILDFKDLSLTIF